MKHLFSLLKGLGVLTLLFGFISGMVTLAAKYPMVMLITGGVLVVLGFSYIFGRMMEE